jgi:hypothetical protein
MPVKSAKQRKAMAAACFGKSTLGIPKHVGCEFIHSKKSKKRRKKK